MDATQQTTVMLLSASRLRAHARHLSECVRIDQLDAVGPIVLGIVREAERLEMAASEG